MTTTRRAVAAAAAILAAITITVIVTHDDATPGHPGHTTVTVVLGGPGRERVALPPAAQAVAHEQATQEARGQEQQAHADLHAEPAAATAPAVLKADEAIKPAGQTTIPQHVPLAAVETPGCRTLLVRNYSSRQGSPILIAVWHYTVSTDSGWAGVLGNVRWFDNPAAQASSTYVIDRRIGACALTVAESQKSWAQAGFNRVALSVEVTANGREGSYLPPGPGRQRAIALLHRFHQVYKLPYRHGAVSGCTVTRTGFVIHKDLGQCGGGHVDTTPYGIDDLIAEAARTDPTYITAVDRATCRKLNAWRNAGRPRGGPWERRSVTRRHALEARRVTCTAQGPIRTP